MPPEMVVNGTTGFLDSDGCNAFVTFGSDKKLKFLALADNYRRETGKWPELGSICDSVGISITTFYRHCTDDKAFKAAWQERLLRGEAVLTSKLADMKNPIGPLSVLRRYFPERWNPDHKITVQHDINTVHLAAGDATQAIDAELVEEPKQIP